MTEPSNQSDNRMAELLAAHERGETPPIAELKSQLRNEAGDEAKDLLGRLDALDFVSSVVGEISDMPERLGDYRLTGMLGRGGMGTVFVAWQESLERDVALKVLAPGLAQDLAMRQRFRAEARATAALHHQHIVPIYGYGEAQGFLYFAMERVNGVSLDKHIASARYKKTRALEPRDAARRFAGVADALGHAHKRRILHRDVKPGNILVHPDGTLALADFGLSKVLGAQSMSMTQGGAFLGTLHYTPPEQALGRDLTPAGDLYSLGVTIFETVTGELPLAGKTTEAMLELLLHGQPRRLREVVPDAPKDLDAVLEKLMHKEPGDRYADGEELARDLVRVADGEPVRIRRQPLVVRLWRRARKNPAQASAAVLFLVLLLAVVLVFESQARERQKESELRWQNEIQLAMDATQNEPGPPAGPRGLFEALTGAPAQAGAEESDVTKHLRAAAALRPDDEQAEILRDAYFRDPAPEATRLIREGRGHEAVLVLTPIIDATLAGTRDDAQRMRLYALFVARAIARLTASVGMPLEARIDVACAKVVRPGALFPTILGVLLVAAEQRSAVALVNDMRSLAQTAGDESRRIALELMRAFARIGRRPEAHMMDFDLPYAERGALERECAQLLGASAPSPRWSGLEASVASFTDLAIRSLADAQKFKSHVDDGERIVREQCDERSALRAWGVLLAWLRERQGGGVPAGTAPVVQQTRALLLLLDLDPPRSVLDDLAPRAADLFGRGEHEGGVELRARWETRMRTQAAFEWADRWVKAEPDEPRAYVCRCEAHALLGHLDEASSDAVVALQRSSDRRALQDALAQVFRSAEERPAQAALQSKWRALRMSFEKQ